MNSKKLLAIGPLALGLAAATATPARAQMAVLDQGHADVGLAYEGMWDLHVHDEVNDLEFEPGDVTLRVNAVGAQTVPSSPAFSFLGSPGSTFYRLSQIEEPGLLFLGIGAEEVADGDFMGDSMQLTLRSATGPGNFPLYLVDGFGNPTVFMNSGDGIGAGDAVTVTAGSHIDYNWAFTAPGLYEIGFEATGIHTVDGPVASGIVLYNFEVIPEPTTWALMGAGGILVFALGKRKR